MGLAQLLDKPPFPRTPGPPGPKPSLSLRSVGAAWEFKRRGEQMLLSVLPRLPGGCRSG